MALSTVKPIVPNLAAEVNNFTFGLTDYIVFVVMLLSSIAIGVYFGFFSKSKNTTDEYLMGGKKMKTIPIGISLVASQLSGLAIMSVPAETYAFGFNYIILVLSMIFAVPALCYIITPVFYENNISNCYEYLQIRFNKLTRQLVTATFVMNAFFMLPVYMYIPTLAFAQVTHINLHLINAIVCGICVFYTMLGGIKAVVWTDVVQGGIMLSSVILVAILGTVKVGGIANVIEYSDQGGRLDFNFSIDPRTRVTVWNSLIGGAIMWTGHIGLSQSCVQRVVSLPSLTRAKKSLQIAGVGVIMVMGVNAYIGLVMYARYQGCDPVLAGLVNKIDKLVPLFVQDVMGHLKGMPGLFISCVFSAALSTLSATLNSVAGVVYFDYIKPFVKHTDARANAIMKCFIVAMGFYCIAGALVVENFKSLLQLVITITGVNTGAVVGVFLLGMFVSRVNGKVAVVSFSLSVLTMAVVVVRAQMLFHAGSIRYDPLPTTIDQCQAKNIHVVIESLFDQRTAVDDLAHPHAVTTAFSSTRDFSIFDTSFLWYKFYGALLVWLIAIPMSFVWKQEVEKINPKLYTPFIRKYLCDRVVELEEIPLKNEAVTLNIMDKENDVEIHKPASKA